jgi:hypothetical protein
MKYVIALLFLVGCSGHVKPVNRYFLVSYEAHTLSGKQAFGEIDFWDSIFPSYTFIQKNVIGVDTSTVTVLNIFEFNNEQDLVNFRK